MLKIKSPSQSKELHSYINGSIEFQLNFFNRLFCYSSTVDLEKENMG